MLGLDQAKTDWRSRYQQQVAYREQSASQDASRYARAYRLFVYAFGARYMSLAFEAGGLDALRAQFASPPLTSHALLASAEGVYVPEFAASEPPAPVPPELWSEVTRETLGAWGVFLALARLTSVAEAHELALGWRGDAAWVYAATGVVERTAVVWKLELADEALAARVATLAFAIAPDVVRAGTRVMLADAAGGTAALDWAFVE